VFTASLPYESENIPELMAVRLLGGPWGKARFCHDLYKLVPEEKKPAAVQLMK